eukprot:1359202-Rhodomonas_salina.2
MIPGQYCTSSLIEGKLLQNPTGPRLEEIAARSDLPASADVIDHVQHSVHMAHAAMGSEKSGGEKESSGSPSSKDSCQPAFQSV